MYEADAQNSHFCWTVGIFKWRIPLGAGRCKTMVAGATSFPATPHQFCRHHKFARSSSHSRKNKWTVRVRCKFEVSTSSFTFGRNTALKRFIWILSPQRSANYNQLPLQIRFLHYITCKKDIRRNWPQRIVYSIDNENCTIRGNLRPEMYASKQIQLFSSSSKNNFCFCWGNHFLSRDPKLARGTQSIHEFYK